MILWRFALPKNSHLASPGSFCFPPPLAQASLARVEEKQNPSALLMGFLLPDQDSNPNIQSQNLSYYHYTIRQLTVTAGCQTCIQGRKIHTICRAALRLNPLF